MTNDSDVIGTMLISLALFMITVAVVAGLVLTMCSTRPRRSTRRPKICRRRDVRVRDVEAGWYEMSDAPPSYQEACQMERRYSC